MFWEDTLTFGVCCKWILFKIIVSWKCSCCVHCKTYQLYLFSRTKVKDRNLHLSYLSYKNTRPSPPPPHKTMLGACIQTFSPLFQLWISFFALRTTCFSKGSTVLLGRPEITDNNEFCTNVEGLLSRIVDLLVQYSLQSKLVNGPLVWSFRPLKGLFQDRVKYKISVNIRKISTDNFFTKFIMQEVCHLW